MSAPGPGAGPGSWVVTGNPTSTELAAVVAVLTAAPPAAGPPPEPPRERWGSPELLLRRAHPFCPQLATADPDDGGERG
ncbi:hypothetical protein NUM3379_30810 [Kineococcus sp. NUM-3379]